jgi:predicted enzyme related to lactoylglutathione lyase
MVGGAGSISPAGATKGVSMGSPVVHFEINSQNPAALHDFYRELFDWQIHVDPEIGYGMVDTKGSGINGGIGPSRGPNQVTFYIEVDDLPATIARIEAAGGKIVVPITEVSEVVSFARFADPDGNVVGVLESTPNR